MKKTITLADFCDYVTYAYPEYVYDDEMGAEWTYDNSNYENDGCGRYINSATGEVLFPDEIEKWFVKGLELTRDHEIIVYVGKDA